MVFSHSFVMLIMTSSSSFSLTSSSVPSICVASCNHRRAYWTSSQVGLTGLLQLIIMTSSSSFLLTSSSVPSICVASCNHGRAYWTSSQVGLTSLLQVINRHKFISHNWHYAVPNRIRTLHLFTLQSFILFRV